MQMSSLLTNSDVYQVVETHIQWTLPLNFDVPNLHELYMINVLADPFHLYSIMGQVFSYCVQKIGCVVCFSHCWHIICIIKFYLRLQYMHMSEHMSSWFTFELLRVGVSYFFRSTHWLCCMCFMLQCTIQKVHTFGLMCSQKPNALFALLPMFSTRTKVIIANKHVQDNGKPMLSTQKKSLQPTSIFRIMASQCFPPETSHCSQQITFNQSSLTCEIIFVPKKVPYLLAGTADHPNNVQPIYALHFQVRSFTTIIL